MTMTDRQAQKTATDEIEITPEMIEAGVAAYYAESREFEGVNDALERIFRAMIEASIKPIRQSG